MTQFLVEAVKPGVEATVLTSSRQPRNSSVEKFNLIVGEQRLFRGYTELSYADSQMAVGPDSRATEFGGPNNVEAFYWGDVKNNLLSPVGQFEVGVNENYFCFGEDPTAGVTRFFGAPEPRVKVQYAGHRLSGQLSPFLIGSELDGQVVVDFTPDKARYKQIALSLGPTTPFYFYDVAKTKDRRQYLDPRNPFNQTRRHHATARMLVSLGLDPQWKYVNGELGLVSEATSDKLIRIEGGKKFAIDLRPRRDYQSFVHRLADVSLFMESLHNRLGAEPSWLHAGFPLPVVNVLSGYLKDAVADSYEFNETMQKLFERQFNFNWWDIVGTFNQTRHEIVQDQLHKTICRMAAMGIK